MVYPALAVVGDLLCSYRIRGVATSRMRLGILAFLIASFAFASLLANDRAPNRSDIVFPNIEYDHQDTGIFETFGTDMTLWGFLPSTTGNFDTSNWEAVVQSHHEDGLKIQARIEWDVVWKGMLIQFPNTYEQAYCLDFDGNPIAYPWNGQENWFCSRQPLFIEYHKIQIRDVALAAEPDSLLFDSQTATPLTYGHKGCFCTVCREDFRAWMGARYSAEELVDKGIENIASWDYREFLGSLGWTSESYGSQVWKKLSSNTIPLAYEYRLFQQQYLNEYMEELAAFAKAEAEYDIAISSSAPLLANEGMRLVHADAVDFYVQEFNHEIRDEVLSEKAISLYKMADATGKRLALTAIPNADWYQLATPFDGVERVDMVWLWVAQAYANGANFIVPRRMWGYPPPGEGGVNSFYTPEPELYADLFGFINRNAALFDGYEAVAPVGLVYSHAAFRDRSEGFADTARDLMRENVPFRLLVAGDEWWPQYLDDPVLSEVDAIVLPSDAIAFIDKTQNARLQTVANKTIDWDSEGLDGLLDYLPRLIELSAQGVSAFPRSKGVGMQSDHVLHLVNRNYDFDTDTVEAQTDLTITLRDSLFGAKATKAFYYAPELEVPIALLISNNESVYSVTVPSLSHWGVVKLVAFGDEDDDGLADHWEIEHFGAIDHEDAVSGADPDGDDQLNFVEHAFDTDPLNPGSRYEYSLEFKNGSLEEIGRIEKAGLSQTLEYSSDLNDWSDFEDLSLEFIDSFLETENALFFRTRYKREP